MKNIVVRKLTGLMICLTLILSLYAPVSAANQIKLVIDGKPVLTDVAPILINGRTMVPVRVISEYLGYTVDWEEYFQRVMLSKTGGNTIVMWIGKNMAIANGNDSYMDSPPVTRGGRTLVPIRFIAESLGLSVYWDSDTTTVTVVSTPGGNAGQSGLGQIYGADYSAFLGEWESGMYGTYTFTANGYCYFESEAGSIDGAFSVDGAGLATVKFDMFGDETTTYWFRVDYPYLIQYDVDGASMSYKYK